MSLDCWSFTQRYDELPFKGCRPCCAAVQLPLTCDLQVVQRLPKTRSGKIMRRVLRKVATEATGELGDLSTLDEPLVVQEIIQAHQRYREQHRKREES